MKEPLVRPMADGDLDAVLELLSTSLGWARDDRHRSFFVWKHHDNPAGRSPAWVAEDDDGLVALRTFLLWPLALPDGTRTTAARAVDTVTHPRAQGRGLFTRLTRHGIDELGRAGIGLIFNTPNDNSRPGYLKMGWQQVGRLRASVRPRGIGGTWRLRGAKVAADKWSEASATGVPAVHALDDDHAVADLLARRAVRGALRTDHSSEHLRWRYGHEPLGYRAFAPDGVAGGMVLFRLRRRGAATEAVMASVLAPPDRERRIVTSFCRDVEADHVLALRASLPPRTGFWPIPGLGPVLIARATDPTGSTPWTDPDEWQVELGDIELF